MIDKNDIKNVRLGYKAFYKGLVNQFGQTYEENKTYFVDDVNYQKEGFCFCEYLEDTLLYYDAINYDVDICVVCGYGKVLSFDNKYNESEILSSSKIIILKTLTREEILEYASHLGDFRLDRFIQNYRLDDNEIDNLLEGENPYTKSSRKSLALKYQKGVYGK